MKWPLLVVPACLALAIPFSGIAIALPAPDNTKPADNSASVAMIWQDSSSAQKIRVQGVPNFGKLNACVWRSGQPSADGLKNLAAMGLKTVVNLQKENPGEKDIVPAGVNYVYIPVQDETAPSVDQGRQFLQVVSDPKNWPVLVHCHAGEGRAGLFSALVRYSFDGWNNSQISDEVMKFRTAYLGMFKTRMQGCQRRFLSDWEQANKPGAYREAMSAASAPAATTAATPAADGAASRNPVGNAGS